MRLAFENRADPVLPRHRFARRMAQVVGVWFLFTLIGLAIGVVGYRLTDGMGYVDAFLNAAMILSGMGPAKELSSDGAKIFAGIYALFSGLFVVVATGFILAPLIHRVLHNFHVDEADEKSDE